ncbi:MAG TPA: hypothetical protein VGR78_07255 [Verrucomicrobiae bacterium]|jgi:hypothetical protein|nr:hypothetical protein [Verrucomicrobiae bacterium]
MAALTAREKRTVRVAVIGIAIYLAVFLGFRLWQKLEAGRTNYQQLLTRLQREQRDVRTAENQVRLFQKLTEAYRLDPRKLPKETLVAEASSAIQNAARQGGFQLGPVRESAGRGSSRELSTIQFDGFGPLPAALTMIHKIQTLGYPVMIDSLQLAQDPTKPGMLKVNATLVILNFEQWKTEEVPNA